MQLTRAKVAVNEMVRLAPREGAFVVIGIDSTSKF
jgi:hypothetical protein